MPKRIIVSLIAIALAAVAISAGWYFAQDRTEAQTLKPFDPEALLAQIDTEDGVNDFLQIESLIGQVMKDYGTPAGFELIDAGEKLGIISNDECHGYLHYVGHAAYAEAPYDYDAMLGIVEGTDCIGGYLHGIEAEIVLQSANVVKDVQDFCQYQIDKGIVPGMCYHGVGHAATELYNYDVERSIALCDTLAGGPEKDLSNCYRGVFSEVGNKVTGYDGHTGLAVDTLSIEGLDEKDPYAYCEQLDTKYRSSCKSQLLKIILNELPIDEWIGVCLRDSFDQHSKEICTNITTGVYIRSELSFQDSVPLPPILNSFPPDLRIIAMMGALESFMGYFGDHTVKDWRPFCEGFNEPSDVAYCSEVFERTIANNEAPWMDFDIR